MLIEREVFNAGMPQSSSQLGGDWCANNVEHFLGAVHPAHVPQRHGQNSRLVPLDSSGEDDSQRHEGELIGQLSRVSA